MNNRAAVFALATAVVGVAIPLDARAEHARLGGDVSASWLHGRVFDVPIDAADVQAGIGATWGGEHGFDLFGVVALQTGRTEAGRALHGLSLAGIEARKRWSWFRLGFGARAGVLAAKRSTGGDSQSYPMLEAYLSVGAEPLAIGRGALFVEGKLHAIDWGGVGIAGLSIGAGVRF